MSVETLESLKRQAEVLTVGEKHILADYLLKSVKNEEIKSNGASETKRQKQTEWLKANREKYGGQYVALDGDCLLGTGKNYAEAFEAARRAGVEDAFVDFIPPKDYIGETGGW